MPTPVLRIIRMVLQKAKRLKELAAPPDAAIIKTVGRYAAIISAYIPYFNTLTFDEKVRFVNRVYHFKKAKQFHLVGVGRSEKIPVLISAAAVQISFGLDKYILPYFRDIYVLPDAYYLKNFSDLYVGHVSPKGIYVSWKHFLEGFANPNDGINTGIHEMAHALEHENFIEESGIDWDFRTDFAKFTSLYAPIFLKNKEFLRHYAYTNFQEFWAVSVEAFFETPQQLKDTMPGLFSVLSEVLNQDPLNTPKLLH